MKFRILYFLTSFAFTLSLCAQSDTLTMNRTTGQINIHPSAGATPNFTALRVGSVTITPVSYGANVATFLATPSSANLASAITGETGSGALVFGTSPTIASPTISGLNGTGNGEHAITVTTGSYVDNVLVLRNDTVDGSSNPGYSAVRFLYGTGVAGGLTPGTEGAAFGLSNANNDNFALGAYMESSSPITDAPRPISIVQSVTYTGGGAFGHVLYRATAGNQKFYGVDINNTLPATATIDIGSSATTRTLRINPNGGFGINVAPSASYDLEVSGNVRFRSLSYLGTGGAYFSGSGESGNGIVLNWGAGGNDGVIITNSNTLSAHKVTDIAGLGYNNTKATLIRGYTDDTGNNFELDIGYGGDVNRTNFYSGANELYFTIEGGVYVKNANVTVNTAGFGLAVKEGANCKQGTATLASGTVTVSTTAVTTNSRIFVTRRSVNGSTAIGSPSVTTITNATSFVVTALKSDATTETNDTSIVSWLITEPAP